MSELLVAGYQKFLEGTTLGLSNATQQNVQVMNQYGQDGLVTDGHSRGGMTTGNAMDVVAQQLNAQGALTNTNINLYGSAYNAQSAANTLNTLSNGNGQVQQATHNYDVIGRVIGGNVGTGGVIPDGSSIPAEILNTFGGSSTVHNNYGDGKTPTSRGQYWGSAGSAPVLVPPYNIVTPNKETAP